ncbi:hypothetical protein [Mycobacteroides abscessus]|uniref:hypothetical protein n=1 Tax=Mycobacteroides abscessus TaxID=36809 RepID=UPI0009D317C8|nr:hypothetical protein [Mycobacteroides abscessus]SLH40609.1 Uncharacterised protein [Mycobacteroides abscessus subsp. massiliense]
MAAARADRAVKMQHRAAQHGGTVATFIDTFIAVSACEWMAQDPLTADDSSGSAPGQ